MQRETLSLLVHAEPKVGKSWLGQTTPGPRLVLDAEGGSRSPKRMGANGKAVRVPHVRWDPTRDKPPEPGDWETCIVIVRDYNTVQRAFEWLNAGRHPFRSVVLDSLTEVQKRCKDSIAGAEAPKESEWGLLLIRMEGLVRAFRDLTFHPTNPIDCVMVLALTQDRKSIKKKPAVQGQLETSLPGYVDVEGFLDVEVTDDGQKLRRLRIDAGDAMYEAGDRTHTLTEHYGSQIHNPDVGEMLRVMNEEG